VTATLVPTQPDSMVPAPEVRPDVLPTDRLTASGMPVPRVREELRRIPNVRNAVNVVSVWVQTVGLLALACWITVRVPLALALAIWAVTFVLMGRGFALLSILGHEAAHRLLFSKKWVNDLVGKWLLSYPAFVPFDAYRRVHFAHHKDEMGPNEPDLKLYLGYPITRDSMRRKLKRDATGNTGWKNLKGLLFALRSTTARPVAAKILVAQLVLFVGLWVGSGRWWLYPLFWLAPWLTVWRVLNRLRSIAEHGGMTRSKDRRETTHLIRQTWSARFWIVPFNTGWHLAHHVDMGVPFQNLPALQRELEQAGWITPALEYPSYRALWQALSSRPAGASER
jgi:fatty acid desaturase